MCFSSLASSSQTIGQLSQYQQESPLGILTGRSDPPHPLVSQGFFFRVVLVDSI